MGQNLDQLWYHKKTLMLFIDTILTKSVHFTEIQLV